MKCHCSGWRWRPPSDTGLQVRVTSNMAKLFVSHVLRKDGTVDRQLASKLVRKVPARTRSCDGVSTVDITIDASTGLWCRIFVPIWADPDKKLPLVIYYHGGGFALFDPAIKKYDSHCRRLSKMCEVVMISVAYRCAPEHKCPTAYEDGFTALEWVASQSSTPHEDFPIDVADYSRVFLAGDSAGGNIVHHVAVMAGTSEASPIALAGMILLQPLFGGEERTVSEIRYRHGKLFDLKVHDWYWRAFLPPGADRDHPFSNVCGLKSPTFLPMNLPKMLVVVGGKDSLQDRQIQYAEMMQSAGKDCKLVFYENAFHGFYIFKTVKTTGLLLHEIEDFIHPPTTEDSKSVITHAESSSPRTSNTSFLDRILSW